MWKIIKNKLDSREPLIGPRGVVWWKIQLKKSHATVPLRLVYKANDAAAVAVLHCIHIENNVPLTIGFTLRNEKMSKVNLGQFILQQVTEHGNTFQCRENDGIGRLSIELKKKVMRKDEPRVISTSRGFTRRSPSSPWFSWIKRKGSVQWCSLEKGWREPASKSPTPLPFPSLFEMGETLLVNGIAAGDFFLNLTSPDS